MDILSWLAVNFDRPILDWIIANLRNPVFDVLMPFITIFGDAGIFWIACALVCIIIPKTRKMGFSMGAALLIGVLLCNVTLKPLCQRPRPYDYQHDVFQKVIPLIIERQHDFSFPSGHTIASFEACTVMLLGSKKLGIPATLLAILIAFSRMYLYVHYPTDVIASVILGTLFGIIGYAIAKKIPMKRGKYEKVY